MLPSTASAEQSGQPGANAALRALKIAFTCIAFLAMALAVWNARQFLRAAWSELSVASLFAAVGLWALTHLVSPLFLTTVLGRAMPLDYRQALAVHSLRLPSKYLPGGIWHMVGRVTDLHGMGYARQSLVEFVLMENLVAAGFALGVGATLLFAFGHAEWRWLMGAVGATCLAGLMLVPWAIRLVTRSSGPVFTARRFGRVLGVTALFWTVASLAFVVFAMGFDPPVIRAGVPEIAGIYLFSWGAGFVAFFAPQGVGVFEFVAGNLLAGSLDLAQAVSLMASFRLVVLAGDLAAWTIALTLFRRLSADPMIRRS